MRLDNAHFFNQINKNKMRKFRIEFQDKDQNELWAKLIEAYDFEDAKKYGDLILAETSHNDLHTFRIDEL